MSFLWYFEPFIIKLSSLEFLYVLFCRWACTVYVLLQSKQHCHYIYFRLVASLWMKLNYQFILIEGSNVHSESVFARITIIKGSFLTQQWIKVLISRSRSHMLHVFNTKFFFGWSGWVEIVNFLGINVIFCLFLPKILPD